MSRVPEWARRHPLVADALLAVLVAAVALPTTLGGAHAAGVLVPGAGVAGAGWVLFAAVHVPIAWRRRAPVLAFWAVIGLLAISVLAGVTGVFLITTPLVALYAVARRCPVRHLWPAATAIVIALGLAWWQDAPAGSLIGICALVAATALLGTTLKLRRAADEERARHAQEELEQRGRVAAAEERSRIAREVHDIVAHNLAVMVALADGAAASVTTGPDAAADMMEKAAATGRGALTEMRRLVGLLREGAPTRSPTPGLADLDELVEQVRAAGLRVTVAHEGEPVARAPGADLTIFRIVQEALTNTLKHAGPGARVNVVVRHTEGGVEVEVVDDGLPFGAVAMPAATGGHGLAGLTERALAYGGQVDAGPHRNGGWRVRAHLPHSADVSR
ncbi:sensor histidine kinase [Pseudonocardia sp. TRM90224]|uniref:sensor histidine kinase n=1 Tax=Pseudonocardia sp. TRM90224 TaxID=2812678 RepID=UPI001E359861|nr:sensor histidine kinase [Pseudonocardia sp. TRM90224]